MTAWRLRWGIRESDQYFYHLLSSFVIRMLNLSVVFICVVVMHHSVIYLWCFILLCLNNCGVIFVLLVNKSRSSLHTYVHLHNISSTPELRLFRMKCWLRSREIIIFAMTS